MAEKKHPLIWANLDQEFENATRQAQPATVETLTNTEIERLAALYHHRLLEEDEEIRREGLNDRAFRKLDEIIDINEAGAGYDLARGDISLVEWEVDDLLSSHGIQLNKGSNAYNKLSYEILKATVRASKELRERQGGGVVDTPPMPSQTVSVHQPSNADSETITTVFDKWDGSAKRPLKTVNEFRRHIRRFVEVCGDLPVDAITKRHISAYRETIVRLPTHLDHKTRKLPVPKILERTKGQPDLKRLSPGAVQKAIRAVSAVLGYAVESGYVDHNVASGVKVRGVGTGQVRRKDYEIHHLNTIFGSPVFTEGERPKGGGGEAAAWLPLLSLYSGARLEELGQLLVNDVKTVDGVDCLELDTFGGGKKLKTVSSRRIVPIHSELVRIGFLKHVDKMREAKERRVFPNVTSGALEGETKTAAFSAWWSRYVRGLGIDDVDKPFHAFRHTFKTFCRASKIAKEYHDAITGHAGSDVGDGYGSGHPVSVLVEEVEKLTFRGLMLSAEDS